MRDAQGQHLPEGEAEGEDVGAIRDDPARLQRLRRLPGLRAHVAQLGIAHCGIGNHSEIGNGIGIRDWDQELEMGSEIGNRIRD